MTLILRRSAPALAALFIAAAALLPAAPACQVALAPAPLLA